MKKTQFSEAQIVSILKKQEAGMKTSELYREYGISEATFYYWKAKYGGRWSRTGNGSRNLRLKMPS